MLVVCPCCNGKGTIIDKPVPPPVRLTAMQHRIWDIVRRAESGIAVADLVDRVYANCRSPENARSSVVVTVSNANKRLATAKQRIASTRGHGATYTLQHIDDK